MGFLNNLIRRETKKAVSSAISSGLSDLLGGSADNSSSSTTTYHSSDSANGCASAKAQKSGESGLRMRLEQVLTEEWSGYEIRRQVPAAEFDAARGAWKYSYGIYSAGQPKAMLMVLNNRNDYRLKAVRDAKAACEQKGIPYMNFFSHLPNQSDYIAQRLKDNISL